jgi:Pyruvate/2-oxoacid:ferredoxin oxidoreductase delta subunit
VTLATNDPSAGRIIRIKDGIIGPREPRLRSVRPQKISDYPGVPAPYLEVARIYSNPLLWGPPICDELIALVEHMYTEEEASLVQHLKALPGKTAAAVAVAAHRPVEEVRSILERLALEKFVLLSSGTGDKKRYYLMPLMPGAFEMVLVRTSLDTLTDWHRRFAELIEALYETGYFLDYIERPSATVRYVPVGEAIEVPHVALPADRLEAILDRYEVFAVGLCQCRMAQEIVGRGCGRSMENCVGFGDVAELLIRHGRMRRVEKKDVLEIKAEAEAAGLATWMFETELGKSSSGASCSCCGCCCDALRTISEFNAPGMIAPPHFRPKVDLTKCMYCGKCAKICPVGAVVVDTKGKSHQHLTERCIGCGLCAVACDKQHAIQMEPTPKYREPPRSLISALLQTAPNYLRSAWSVWRKYR